LCFHAFGNISSTITLKFAPNACPFAQGLKKHSTYLLCKMEDCVYEQIKLDVQTCYVQENIIVYK